jgi:hypothetical protein
MLTKRSSVWLETAAARAALRDVLLIAPGGLHHLVDGTGALVEETAAERDCSVVDKCGYLIAAELPIASAGTEAGSSFRMHG